MFLRDMGVEHHFNPRSPHGERRFHPRLYGKREVISIHAPRTGSDPLGARRHGCRPHNFNPRSPHGERLEVTEVDMQIILISIHAPRTGSDETPRVLNGGYPISIHAPRTGSDRQRETAARERGGFQSTLPARGATHEYHENHQARHISIHAPRTGSDRRTATHKRRHERFQSTLPARGATLLDSMGGC